MIYCIKDCGIYKKGEAIAMPRGKAEALMREHPGCFTKGEKKAQSVYSDKQIKNYSNKSI